MEYRRINVSEIDALWELQKLYKYEIGEEEPDKLGKERLVKAIDDESILFFGAWDGDKLIDCADCDLEMYKSLGFTIPLGNLLAFE